jgi:hypothetical protein
MTKGQAEFFPHSDFIIEACDVLKAVTEKVEMEQTKGVPEHLNKQIFPDKSPKGRARTALGAVGITFSD